MRSNMSGLETFFTNSADKNRVQGLERRDIAIAQSAALQQAIHDFMVVAADKPTFTAEGHEFNHRRVSLLGSYGTMISVYMQQSAEPTRSTEQSHVLLTATLDNPIVTAWSTTLLPQSYGSNL